MGVYLSGKRISETFDIFKSQLSHFSLCVIIPSFFIHLMLCLFSLFFLLFCFFVFLCPLLLWLLLFRRKKLPHRGNFAGICEQICYDFSFFLHLANCISVRSQIHVVSTWLHHWLFVTVCLLLCRAQGRPRLTRYSNLIFRVLWNYYKS